MAEPTKDFIANMKANAETIKAKVEEKILLVKEKIEWANSENE